MQNSTHPDLDLLVLAEQVHTLDDDSRAGDGADVTAIGVLDGSIVWLGSADDAEPERAGQTVRDVACAVPGFVDAHIHPVLGLEMARGVDLSQVTTVEELQEALRAAVEDEQQGSAGEWILGWGLDPTYAGADNPSARELDAAVADRPVLLRLFDAHSAVVNSRALELVGLTGQERFASASEVETGPDGRPTGFLKEWEAIALVTSQVPQPSFDSRTQDFLGVLGMMADAGLTGGQILDYSEGMIDLLEAVERNRDLPIRLQVSPWIMPSDDEDRLQQVIDLQGRSGRRWRVDGVKLMIDGTIDNGTAWLREPDVNGQSTGPLWLDPESYTTVLRRLDALGIRTTTHAIGDAGVDHVLAALESLPPREDANRGEGLPRHRIEHLETVPDETVERMVRADVAASMQPTHCTLYCSADGSDNWSRRLGPERASRAWRLGSVRRAGVPLAVGSDWPVAPCEPLRIMADGQLRREAGRPEQTAIVPEESLSARELLEGYTTQRALSWGDPDGGRIRVGAPADLTLLGADPLTTAPDDLPQVSVLGTVVGGELREVHSGPADR